MTPGQKIQIIVNKKETIRNENDILMFFFFFVCYKENKRVGIEPMDFDLKSNFPQIKYNHDSSRQQHEERSFFCALFIPDFVLLVFFIKMQKKKEIASLMS